MAYSKQTWDTTSYVNPTRMNHIEQGIESVEQEIPEIADNLTTDDSTKALSAKQGKVLNEKIDENSDLKIATSSTHTGASIRYIQTGRLVTAYGSYTPQTSSTEEIKTTLPKPSAIFTVPFRTQSGNMGLIYFDSNGSLQQWNHTGTITAGQAVQFNFTYICNI